MKLWVFLLLVIVACSGQTCGGPLPTDTGADPEVKTQLGIPQGTYTGTRVCQFTGTVSNSTDPPVQNTVTQFFTQTFGPDGTLVGPGGSPTLIGGVRQNQMGGMLFEETVREIHKDTNRLAIITDVTCTITVGTVEVALTGVGQESYTYQEPDAVEYVSSSTVASPVIEGHVISFQYSYSGTLTR